MYRFWNHVIEPFLTIIRPRVLVEVGASDGKNSRNIARWCLDNDAHAHIIDPAPGFEFSDLQKAAPDNLTFHKALSLDALPSLHNIDVALIDGDHNWHTVFSELRSIYGEAEKTASAPVVFLHDICWPYARRDLYYDPSDIAEENRQPFMVGGIDPDNGLVVLGQGINRAYAHALKEGGAKNGVLTAVEDFMKGDGADLSLLRIPVLNGLGILYPNGMLDSPEFANLIQALQFNQTQDVLLKHADKERLRTALEAEDLRHSVAELDLELQSAGNWAETRAKLMEMSDWATSLQTQLAEKDASLAKKDALLAEKDASLAEKNASLAEKDALLAEKDASLAEKNASLAEKDAWLAEKDASLAEKDAQLGERNATLKEKDAELTEKSTTLANRNATLKKKGAELAKRKTALEKRDAKLAEQSADLQALQEKMAAKQNELMTMSHWAAGMRDRLQVVDETPVLRAMERMATAVRERGAWGTARLLASKMLPRAVSNIARCLVKRRKLRGLRHAVSRAPKKVLVVYPIIPWDFRWQRPQQILSRLASKGWTVLYVDMQPMPAGRCYATEQEAFLDLGVKRIDDDVWGVSLYSCESVNMYTCSLQPGSIINMKNGVLALLETIGAMEPIQIVQFPSWTPVAQEIRAAVNGNLVFDCMDDHSGFAGTTREAVSQEMELIGSADMVLASSELIYERSLALNPATEMLRNGTEFEHFNGAVRCGALDHLTDKPIIGYYGAIAEWFDMGLLAYCAKTRPQWNFVLVGHVHGVDVNKVEGLPNVHFVGEVPYADLPGYFAYFDVCTIPFKLIPLIMATNPVKFYEYLSDAKPVVSVELPELRPYAALCHLASNEEDFLRKLDTALNEDASPELIEARLQLARDNSWDGRVQSLLQTDIFRTR